MKRTVERVLFTEGPYRIVEIPDETYRLEDLKGDCFNPEVNTDIDPKDLRRDELKFERRVNDDGVFGYILERWNPEIGHGWEHIDSCFGFIGSYTEGAEDYEHYIVEEFKKDAKSIEKKEGAR